MTKLSDLPQAKPVQARAAEPGELPGRGSDHG
jgi:hypothetical protein